MQLAEAVNTCSRISLSSDRLGSEHVVLTTEKTWRGQGMHTQRTKSSCGRGCQGGLTIALLGWSALKPCAVVGGDDNEHTCQDGPQLLQAILPTSDI